MYDLAGYENFGEQNVQGTKRPASITVIHIAQWALGCVDKEKLLIYKVYLITKCGKKNNNQTI